MRFIVLPIESLEERYSAQWNRWWERELVRLGIEYLFLHPEPIVRGIVEGEFLDIVGTVYFKAQQISEVCKLIFNGEVGREDDVFIVHDYWFPGIEGLGYIRDLKGLGFKIVGILHAGTWDPWDFISQRGLGRWAKDIELGWLKMADMVVVATEWHKRLLKEYWKSDVEAVRVIEDKVVVLPFLYFEEDIVRVSWEDKENIVVFPHRKAPEKGIWFWYGNVEKWEKRFKGWKFVATKDICKTKRQYYELLAKSKISVSFAYQETWGIAMIESVLSGCIPIVPNRCSYVELYPEMFRYSSMGEMEEKLEMFVKAVERKGEEMEEVRSAVDILRSSFRYKFGKGVEEIVNEVKVRWF